MSDNSVIPVTRQGTPDLESMWVALLEGHWNSLAVIPIDDRISIQPHLDALRAGMAASGDRLEVFDARGTDVGQAKRLAADVSAALAARTRVVVVVDSLIRSLSGIHLVQPVQAIVLLLQVGAMDLDSLTSTVAIVGSERIIGSVTGPGGA